MPYGHRVRIAHVSDCYLPRTGGIETQVRALATRQAVAGMDVRVITATPVADVAVPITAGVPEVPVHRCTMRMPFDLPIHLRTRAEVTEVLRRDPVDVLHVHAGVISPFAWGALRAAHRLRLPALVTVHSIWGGLARPAVRASDGVIGWTRWGLQLSAVSQLAADRIAAAVPQAGPVLVIPNGIDAASWQIDHVSGPPSTLRLVTVMRLAPRKRLLPLLKIVQRAQERLSSTATLRLTIIGDGPERARAERAVRGTGLVEFAGRLDQTGILARLAYADAYVQPSVKESFGIAALEARAAGLPVVARSQAGTAQFIRDGVEGLLVDSDTGMVDAIVRLATDQAVGERIRAHNTGVAPEQTWEHVMRAASDGYAHAIDRIRPAWGSA